MIEVLFTESAAGSMQYAKSLKHTIGEATSVFLITDDGSEPSEEEVRKAQEEAEERRRKWLEKAVPMEGSARDVVCLPLALSMGDISEPLSDRRAEYLQSMVLISGDGFAGIGRTMMQTARDGMEKVLEAVRKGGPIRVWYSHNPDELCGFCHLMAQLPQEADIRVVELPEYEVKETSVITYTGWGEVDPGALAAFLPRERKLTEPERRHFAFRWNQLARENGPLRAVVNGRLMTVGVDFYDHFILTEIGRAEEEFHEARLVGNVLGKYQLGIGDWFIAMRIEEFISRGMLVPMTEPGEGNPIYHRMLRKAGTI